MLDAPVEKPSFIVTNQSGCDIAHGKALACIPDERPDGGKFIFHGAFARQTATFLDLVFHSRQEWSSVCIFMISLVSDSSDIDGGSDAAYFNHTIHNAF